MAAITVIVAQVTDNRVTFAIAFAIYLIGLGPFGWTTLTEPDEEWTQVSPRLAVA